MAKKKRKSKAKKKSSSSAAAEEEAAVVPASETEGEADASADEEDGEASDESDADAEDEEAAEDEEEEVAAAPRERGRAEKPTVNIRPGAAEPQSPLIPSPDGPRVSHKGGLVFVAIVVGLMGLAIAAQFMMG